jgi:hypothetical protein
MHKQAKQVLNQVPTSVAHKQATKVETPKALLRM